MKNSVSAEGRYSGVSRKKAAGATYTPDSLARFVARQIVTASTLTRGAKISVCDPAVGDGMLLASLLRELHEQGHTCVSAFGFDTDPDALVSAERKIRSEFSAAELKLEVRDFLEAADLPAMNGDFSSSTREQFDLVIANPPYVRTQILGASRAQALAQSFGLTGRVDLYYAFMLGMRRLLKPGGTLGVIVSNRFMTTRAGQSVREMLQELYELIHIWDLGDSKLFEAAVLPAVVLARTRSKPHVATRPAFTTVYETTLDPIDQADDLVSALGKSGVVAVGDGRRFSIVHGCLDTNGSSSGVWRVSNSEKDDWLARVERHSWGRFSDLGKIRVGVKTTADRVFIRDDWDALPDMARPELLRTLTTHHMARGYRPRDDVRPKEILYTHTVEGGRRTVVDVAVFPNSLRYLEQHRALLERRTYVIEAGRKWFEIWVPHDPLAWSRPKIVFPDISSAPVFWIDLTGSVVNGDCYWIAPTADCNADLLWLALAVGNSRFIIDYYDHRFNNRLYAGRRRFITQYVSQFPIPDPSLDESRELIRLAKQIFETTPSERASGLAACVSNLVYEAFGLAIPEAAREGNLQLRVRHQSLKLGKPAKEALAGGH